MSDASYTELMELVTDDQLWAKKADLAASLLATRHSASQALDAAFIDLFNTQQDVSVAKFTTSKGRPARVILVVGEEAVDEADEYYGEDPE